MISFDRLMVDVRDYIAELYELGMDRVIEGYGRHEVMHPEVALLTRTVR